MNGLLESTSAVMQLIDPEKRLWFLNSCPPMRTLYGQCTYVSSLMTL